MSEGDLMSIRSAAPSTGSRTIVSVLGTPRARRAFGTAATLGAVLAPVAVAPAGAASIAYIKASNVWLANPDGSGQYQVTTDGTSANPYASPSQADDGTIVALRSLKLRRMRQNGEQLNTPTDLPGSGGISEVAISPNGQIVAFSRICGSGVSLTMCVSYTGPNGTGQPASGPGGFRYPSWIDNTRTLVSTGNAVYTHVLGTDVDHWFNVSISAEAQDGEVAGSKLVMVDHGSNPQRLVFSRRLDNGFDTSPEETCEATNPADGPNGASFADPTWAPGGGLVAWQEGDGIWTATSNDVDDCPAIIGTSATIAGGSEPDFGPAAVNPGPRPTSVQPAGGATSTPTVQPLVPRQPQTQTQTQTQTRPGATQLVRSPARLLAKTFPVRRGFRFRLNLSRAARVTVRVERLAGARGRVLGSVAFQRRAGANTFTVTKVKGKALRPGRYRARVVASSGGTASTPVILSFRLR